MLLIRFITICTFVAVTTGQNYDYEPAPVRPAPPRLSSSGYSASAPKPTPVPILKQINRHNEDGSYTYGYEGADGSFKIETKLPTGEVKGKYGYVDDTGKVRVVEYGATKYGFEPAGEEYTAEYYDPPAEPAPRPLPAARPKPRPSFDSYSPPQQFAPAPERSPIPQRASISGAAPSDFDFAPKPRPSTRNFAPAPARPASTFSFDDDNFDDSPVRSAPKISYAQPAPLPLHPGQASRLTTNPDSRHRPDPLRNTHPLPSRHLDQRPLYEAAVEY
ncbi:Insect cuticle protein [Popillia japonica]|uniref:Insect cuticle protein n=1 Tax=Popillia japonica TaxID=7064 RepID=A0AAW1LV18_POPJA